MNQFISFLIFILLIAPLGLQAQIQYYVPTHYQGLFYMQPTSARATGMGLTTITLEGIEHAFYNPATIGLTDEQLAIHLNYASGSQVYKGGQYPFLGVSYRINDKLVIGGSTFHWIDSKDSVWTTIIGFFNEPVDRRSQSMYNLIASYEVIPNLQAGISGNYIVDKSVSGSTVTNSEFLLSLGAIYDRDVRIFKNENVQNQSIRFAASLVNALMKNRMEQTFQDFLNFRDLPIHLTFGTAFDFSLPLNLNFVENKKYFEGESRQLDLSLHIQIRDVLRGPKDDVVNANHEFNSSFGIGAEAWFMNLFALRMGYYNENRPSGNDPEGGVWFTDNKRGFTWGLGAKVPWNRLSQGKVPFNVELNLVTSKVLNEYANNVTIPDYFTDDSFLFAIGLNLKSAKN